MQLVDAHTLLARRRKTLLEGGGGMIGQCKHDQESPKNHGIRSQPRRKTNDDTSPVNSL